MASASDRKPRNRNEQRLARERMVETGQTYTQALADIRREWKELQAGE